MKSEKKTPPIRHLYPYDKELNCWALGSLEMENDAGKIARDEAISINIITNGLNTKALRILYESEFGVYGGKPDYMIRLGKELIIMVSVTRAFHRKWDSDKKKLIDVFDSESARRLMTKKLFGIAHCVDYSGWFTNDVYEKAGFKKPKGVRVRPIMHVLCPSFKSMKLCLAAYRDILNENPRNKYLGQILMMVSLVRDEIYF